MARNARGRRRLLSRQFKPTRYLVRSHDWEAPSKEGNPKKLLLTMGKRDWEDVTCSVCMDYPHNAVLLLCSSYDKGCRPYMCGTSCRQSNCLAQFQKAYTKVISSGHDHESVVNTMSFGLSMPGWPMNERMEIELSCPLCRGQVKGFTVVKPAREYLNEKKRSCMEDDCSFMGTYKELRKHVRTEHPCAKPREVDPVLEQKWRTLEHERERQDVISTIRSSMPQAVVFGDYAIEMNSDLDPDDQASDGDMDFGGGRNIGRSILYFFLHEGFINLHRDRGASENRDGIDNAPFIGDSGSNTASPLEIASYEDDAVDVPISQGRGTSLLRSTGRRQRRRRRSRGRSQHLVGAEESINWHLA